MVRFICTAVILYSFLFRAWISEMMAIITAMEFPRELQGAEASMARWKEHRAEVDSRKEAVNRFLQTGKAMIDEKHFLSDEVKLQDPLPWQKGAFNISFVIYNSKQVIT